MTTRHPPQPAPYRQARRYLTAVAVGFTGHGTGFTGHGISSRLTRIGGVPVLTIEEPAGGPNPTAISVDPDLNDPGGSLDCTCLWTPPPGAPPEAIADTIIAVLNAIRPLTAAHRPGQ